MANETTQFTAGAQRALRLAAQWSSCDGSGELDAPAVLAGLLGQSECRAAAMLARRGIDLDAVRRHWSIPTGGPTSPPAAVAFDEPFVPSWRFSPDLQASLHLAALWLVEHCQPAELATEHLLWGLAAGDHAVGAFLRQRGLTPEVMREELRRLYGESAEPLGASLLDPPEEASEPNATLDPAASLSPLPPPAEPSEAVQVGAAEELAIYRVIDAAANRAREGLRVVEDYARFVLDDRHLTERLKRLRHSLCEAMAAIPLMHRLAARETQADVGVELCTDTERRRAGGEEVLIANFARLQESLRSLEEYGKLLVEPSTDLAARFEQLRYESYTLQRAVQITQDSLARLAQSRLYVLIDAAGSPEDFEILVRDLVLAGVHVLQLRDKQLGDRELLDRARRLRQLTLGSQTLFVMNDRPDLAALAQADGVHVGQEDLSVKDARSIVGPRRLVGVSVHSIEQARAAVLDGASYLGVGPTYPSPTKTFETYPGLDLLRAVAGEIRLPAFAIGGIDRANLAEVLGTGTTRVAVGSAVTTAENPSAVVVELLARLGGRG